MINGAIEANMNKLVDQLDDYRPDQVAEIQSMQKTLKIAMLKKDFAKHPALTQLINTLKKRERSYTLVLSDKEDLPEAKRSSYYARRAEIRFVISFFDVDSTIESIEKRISDELTAQLSDEVPSDA